jgi:hypothetical protein
VQCSTSGSWAESKSKFYLKDRNAARRAPAYHLASAENLENSQNSGFLACTTSRSLLEVSTFSRDSRKWQSQWFVGENLDWSWLGALLCWRLLGSISEHHSLELGTIPHSRLTSFVIIRESATRCVILLMDFSLLSWWDTTYMLQIVLIYSGMKLINTLCISPLVCYWWVAGVACPMSDTFSPKVLLNKHSVRKFCVYFVSCCLHADYSSWQPTYSHSVSTLMCW